jgi:predicted secreted hydrolase
MGIWTVNPGRRRTLAWLGGLLTSPTAAPFAPHPAPVTPFATVAPGYRMQFPRDEGSHPDFRLEWWYITGWLEDAGKPLGFQVTFFRARPELKYHNPSTFSPRQVVIAHTALSDPAHGKLIHAQRAARAGFGLAGASEGATNVWIDDWSLRQEGAAYRARVLSRDYSLDLTFAASQSPLLQGGDGLSRKGPRPEFASYYYSVPQLAVDGIVSRTSGPRRVTGLAWLDHEWSSQYLAQEASGWDWIGINLNDGSALMAFRMRRSQNGDLWAGGALRRPDGRVRIFSPGEIRFTPRRTWRSARTGTSYPVAFLVEAADTEIAIEPLFDDQENDARATSGTIYWEGAVRALRDGKPVGRGYLELTGYWRKPDL